MPALTRVRRRLETLGVDVTLLLTGAVVALLTWPLPNLDPQPSLDSAWAIALHQAVHHGLDFGPDVLFTYGPLGFLREPLLVWPWTARIGFAYAMATHFAMVLALLWAVRRTIASRLLAALLVFVVAGTITQEPVFVVAFIGAIALLESVPGSRRSTVLAAALGVLAGVELLAKFNAGLTMLALGITALAFLPRTSRRPAVAFLAAFLLAAAAGWFGTGQPVTTVPSFLSGEIAIASGYSEVMGYAQLGPEYQWEYWAAFVLACIGAAAAWICGSQQGRLGRLVLWVVFAFFTFKSGFVRQDPPHMSIYFASVVGGLCAFAVPRRHRGAAVLAGLLALTTMFAAARADPAGTVRPLARAGAFFDQVGILTDGSTTNDQIAAARARVAGLYAIDPASLALVGDHSVHVDPVDAGLAWALRLRWEPLPIFQTYSAYTPDLDRRNAEKLADPDGPERIIRDAQMAIDGRNPAFDPPASMRAMLCHFESESVVGRWQVLARVPDRCGAAREIREVKTRYGDSVAVPVPPDRRSAVIAELEGVEVSGLESLRTAALRALPRGIAVDDDATTYRLVPSTAAEGVVITVPPGSDYPSGFPPAQPARFVRVTKGSDVEQPDDELTVRFLAMPIR